MNTIICNKCGRTNFSKQDNFFVCENCRNKYTVDDVRRIMAGEKIEPTIDEKNDSIGKRIDKANGLMDKGMYAEAKKELHMAATDILDVAAKLITQNYNEQLVQPMENSIDVLSQVAKIVLPTLSNLFLDNEENSVIDSQKEEIIYCDIMLRYYIVILSVIRYAKNNSNKAEYFTENVSKGLIEIIIKKYAQIIPDRFLKGNKSEEIFRQLKNEMLESVFACVNKNPNIYVEVAKVLTYTAHKEDGLQIAKLYDKIFESSKESAISLLKILFESNENKIADNEESEIINPFLYGNYNKDLNDKDLKIVLELLTGNNSNIDQYFGEWEQRIRMICAAIL